eukprot:CAMPEP_0168734718 /NCGR_PEP_ID=MMETSP0724-20121128/8959_1 /TAXON_ID=265536 /ORGANISM="Amphiprora sp., Strain CCMP467" /LENGTH=70 /DNA_ID=CAMNT_0008781833 /DNA_START=56 /DNA_END=265 /DNA_ORIENTATION=-
MKSSVLTLVLSLLSSSHAKRLHEPRQQQLSIDDVAVHPDDDSRSSSVPAASTNITMCDYIHPDDLPDECA